VESVSAVERAVAALREEADERRGAAARWRGDPEIAEAEAERALKLYAIADALAATIARDRYTVFATYEDNRQRFATVVSASGPKGAERAAREEAEGEIVVAAVVAGSVDAVDEDPCVSS
jgi:hypothetical protein